MKRYDRMKNPTNSRIWLLLILLNTSMMTGFAQNKQSNPSRNFMIGIDNSGDKCHPGEFFNRTAMEMLGVDFVIYHLRTPRGSIEDEVKKMEKLGKDFQQANLNVIVNVECGNWNLNIQTSEGFEWVSQPGNLHLFQFPSAVLKTLNQSEAVWGIQYDELEHSQLTRNLTITLEHPGIERATLVETTGMDFKSADKAVYQSTKKLVNECRNDGTRNIFTEHVWPVLFHNFARAGMIPVYKQMKENWSNVWASCAMGACLQYDKELWACLDFWNYNTFPGHSAETLRSNLLFAYWAGVDKAYVEAVGKHTYEVIDDNMDHIKLKERGEVLSRFAKEYVPNNPRPYTFRDLEPEIAIIRFDDTEWGQGPKTSCSVDYRGGKIEYHWKDRLFGAYNLNTSPESEEWIKAWHTITHGMVKQGSLSWNACNIYGEMPYRCFAPANFPVVFDDQVAKKHLKGLKLVFLCGLYMSNHTLKDVASLVKNDGLVVVTSKRFAPSKFSAHYLSGTKEFNDGKGKWIITDDMASDHVKKLVAHWLGNDNEIVLRFKGDRTITLEISSDGNELNLIENTGIGAID